MVFYKLCLIKSISAVTIYNSSSCLKSCEDSYEILIESGEIAVAQIHI